MTDMLKNNLYTLVISDVIQILLLFFILYNLVKFIKDSRAFVIIKGLFIVFLIYGLVYLLKLDMIQFMIEQSFSFIAIAIIIMFQPDLQKIIESIGKTDFKTWFKKLKKDGLEDSNYISNESIEELVKACGAMSKVKTGALIVIEKDIPLRDIKGTGIVVNGKITNQLLINIFEKNTPLHDGAVIIANNLVDSATCYLPLTKSDEISKSLGTRHRAALGISEATDCLVIVVSEETGKISVCDGGKISHGINTEMLRKKLIMFNEKDTDEESGTKVKKKKLNVNLTSLLLKLAVGLVSIFIWFLITNLRDSEITVIVKDVPVSMTHDDVIDSIGQVYQVVEGSTVDVLVTGRQSVVSTFTTSDIKAIADLRKLSQVNSVPITVSLVKNDENISLKTDDSAVVIVKLEDIVEKEFAVTVDKTGRLQESYYLDIESIAENTIKVSAPASKIEQIDRVILPVDITNKTSDYISFSEPKLLNSDGKEIDMKGVDLSTNQIKVSVKAYETKVLPIVVDIENTSNTERYELNGYELSTRYVKVAGTEEQLSEINDVTITVDLSTSSDLANALIVDLKNYISEDLFIVTEKTEINIKLDVTKYLLQRIDLFENNINIVGLDNKKQIVIDSKPNSIILYVESNLDKITLDMLNPTLTVNNEIGSHTGTITLTQIDKVTIESPLDITYTIIKRK